MTKAQYKYLQIHPRGFLNEYVIYRVPLAQFEEVKLIVADYEDDHHESGGFTNWIKKPLTNRNTIDWHDREYFGR